VLKKELETRMLPIFPDAALEYVNVLSGGEDKEEAAIKKAEEKIFGGYKEGLAKFSQYAKKVLGDAESLKDLGTEQEQKFIDCSMLLFGEYKKYEINK
jgi:hypothetical protein